MKKPPRNAFFKTSNYEHGRMLVKHLGKQSKKKFDRLPVCPTAAYPDSDSVIQFLNGRLYVIDVNTLDVSHSIENIDMPITHLFSINGEYVAGLCANNSILTIWSFRDKKLLHQVQLETSDLGKISCTHSSVFVANSDGIFRWKIEMGNISKELFKEMPGIKSLIALDDASVIVTRNGERERLEYYQVTHHKITETCKGAAKIVITPNKYIYFVRDRQLQIQVPHMFIESPAQSNSDTIGASVQLLPISNDYLLMLEKHLEYDDISRTQSNYSYIHVYGLEVGKIIHSFNVRFHYLENIVVTAKGTLLILSGKSSNASDLRWFTYSFNFNPEDAMSNSEESKGGVSFDF